MSFDEPEIMTAEEVAELLRTSVNTLYFWRRRKYGPPAAMAGRNLRYRRSDVLGWLDDQMEVYAA